MNKKELNKIISLLTHQNLCVVNNGTKEYPDFVVGGTDLLNKELIKLFSLHVVSVPKGTLPLNKLKDGIDEYLDGQINHQIERTPERMRTIKVVAYHCKRIAEDLTK